eukprot:scaffold63493_cov69-Phaeocystis_antarctica.AAC.1
MTVGVRAAMQTTQRTRCCTMRLSLSCRAQHSPGGKVGAGCWVDWGRATRCERGILSEIYWLQRRILTIDGRFVAPA